MRTIAEVLELPGITKTEDGIDIHFSSKENWYDIESFCCPICDNEISWNWYGEIPLHTNAENTKHLKPQVRGAILLRYAHRWIMVECANCHLYMRAENFVKKEIKSEIATIPPLTISDVANAQQALLKKLRDEPYSANIQYTLDLLDINIQLTHLLADYISKEK